MRVRDGLKVNGAETIDFYREQMFYPPEDLREVKLCVKSSKAIQWSANCNPLLFIKQRKVMKRS